MARKTTGTTAVRLSADAISWAHAAAGLSGESLSAYASRALAERGEEDVARLSAERLGFPRLPRPKPKPKPKGK